MTSVYNTNYLRCNACRACPEYIVEKVLNRGQGPVVPLCEECSAEFVVRYQEYKSLSYGDQLCPDTLCFTKRKIENPRNRKIPLTIEIPSRKATPQDIKGYIKRLTKERNMRISFERRFLRGFADRGHSLYLENISNAIDYFEKVELNFSPPQNILSRFPQLMGAQNKPAPTPHNQPCQMAQTEIDLSALFCDTDLQQLISSLQQIINEHKSQLQMNQVPLYVY